MKSVVAIMVLVGALHAQQADSARLAGRPFFVAAIARYTNAAGLPDLEVGPHVPGDREIRVWIGGGLGWPQSLYRLIERKGVVTGEYIRYWDRDDPATTPDSIDFAALMRYTERGRCGPIKRGPDAETCLAHLVSTPPWPKIWRTIDSLGVWVLPDSRSLKGGYVVLDGWGIAVETWDGAAYRAWAYSSPDHQPWPEGKRAAAIAYAFDTVAALLKRPAGMQRLRGKILTRADTLEFVACDGSGPFLLELDERPLIALTGRGDSTLPYRLPHAYYVEFIALPEPDYVVRKWWSLSPYYAGALMADSLSHFRPWAPEWCKR